MKAKCLVFQREFKANPVSQILCLHSANFAINIHKMLILNVSAEFSLTEYLIHLFSPTTLFSCQKLQSDILRFTHSISCSKTTKSLQSQPLAEVEVKLWSLQNTEKVKHDSQHNKRLFSSSTNMTNFQSRGEDVSSGPWCFVLPAIAPSSVVVNDGCSSHSSIHLNHIDFFQQNTYAAQISLHNNRQDCTEEEQ